MFNRTEFGAPFLGPSSGVLELLAYRLVDTLGTVALVLLRLRRKLTHSPNKLLVPGLELADVAESDEVGRDELVGLGEVHPLGHHAAIVDGRNATGNRRVGSLDLAKEHLDLAL